MKIAVLPGSVWDSHWGHDKELIRVLAQHHEVTIIDMVDYGLRFSSAPRRVTYPLPEGASIIRRQTKRGLGPALAIYFELSTLRDLLLTDYDVFVAYATVGALLATMASKLLNKKVVLIYADDLAEFYSSKSKLAGAITRSLFTPAVVRLADRIITTAHLLKEDMLKYNNQVSYIPNGVHLEKFRCASDPTEEPNGPFTVGFVGGFGEWVDFPMVLTTARQMPSLRFLLVGDGPEYAAVCQQVTDLPNVELTGRVPHSRVIQEIRRMDVGLVPFKVNRLTDRVSPVKLFEYWAMGKPVVTTRFHEIQVTAGDRVLYVNDATELQMAISLLQDDPSLRCNLAERGSEAVRAYDWSILAQRYLEIFRILDNGT